MTARVNSISAQKGGVGKTTTTVQGCLATSLLLGKRTLLIDVDPQKNSTSVFVSEEQIEENPNVCASRLYKEGTEMVPLKGKYGVDVIPGDTGILAFPQDMTEDTVEGMMERLKENTDLTANDLIQNVVDSQLICFVENINKFKEEYDHIFIDTPPSFLGLPLISALCASTDIMGLVEPTRFSSDVVESFIEKVNLIKENYNPEMEFHGFVINKARGQSQRHQTRINAWLEQYPDLFVKTPIKINAWLEDSTEDGEPCWKNITSSTRRDGAKNLLTALAHFIPEIKKVKGPK